MLVGVGNLKLAKLAEAENLATNHGKLLLKLGFVGLLHDHDQLHLLAQPAADLLRPVGTNVQPVGRAYLNRQRIGRLADQRAQTG